MAKTKEDKVIEESNPNPETETPEQENPNPETVQENYRVRLFNNQDQPQPIVIAGKKSILSPRSRNQKCYFNDLTFPLPKYVTFKKEIK